MKTSTRFHRTFFTGILALWSLGATAAPPPAPAPAGGSPPAGQPAEAPPPDQFTMGQWAREGGEAFDKGDYKTAVARLTPYLQYADKMGIKENRDVLIYVLGTAHAVLQEWGPAVDLLRKYEKEYPTGEFFKEVVVKIGRCLALSKDYKGAVAQFEKVRNDPAVKDEVLPMLAECYENNEQTGEAVRVLEEWLASGYNSTERINGALRLCRIYLGLDQVEKGIAVLDKIKASPSAADFVIIVNGMALQAASNLAENQPELALRAYQAVRRKAEVMRLQKERNDALKAKLAEWDKLRRGKAAPRYQSLIDEGTSRLKQLESMLEDLEKEQAYDAMVIYHIGRCFAKAQRYWEAELAFRTIQEKYPTYQDKANAAFGRIVALYNLKPKEAKNDGMKINEKIQELGLAYLRDYPTSEGADTVAELLVTQLMEAKDFERAKKVVDKALEIRPDGTNNSRMLFYKASAEFELYAWKDARATLENFRAKYPEDALIEEVDYRHALTYFFDNDYKNTLESLGKYVAKYPNGGFVADARYRLNIVKYGEQQAAKTKAGQAGKEKFLEYQSNFYEHVIKDVDDIIAKFPDTPIMGELHALRGDCYDQMTPKEVEALGIDQIKESGDAYRRAAEKATNDDVLDYSMEQARTKLQAAARWPEIRELHETFLRIHPKHPDRLKAISWVVKAIQREQPPPSADGKPPDGEAMLAWKAKKNEEVKKFLAREIMANINKPNQEGVEMLLEQLASACIPKRKRLATSPAASPTTPGTITTATAPSAPAEPEQDIFAEASAELDKQLGAGTGSLNKTGEARLLYTKSRLVLMSPKRDPATKKMIDRTPEAEKIMDDLGAQFDPEDFSSTLLAFVGDHLKKRGIIERATACYNRLLNFFPNSDFLDFGLVGLGDLALEAQKYSEAEKFYARARDEFPGMKYPNALLGIAKAQIAQKNYTDPEGPLKEVVGEKAWKGEMTAEALYLLGESSFGLKQYEVAHNYYQRIYLSFGKFPEWAIKGFSKAAECLRAMGKPAEAKKTIEEGREFLKKKKLENSPLAQQLK